MSIIFSASALIISAISLFYTIRYNTNNTKKQTKEKQNDYLKLLTRLINKMAFVNTPETKEQMLNTLREELIFCSVFENDNEFNDLSKDIDDKVYMLYDTKEINIFKQTKEKCLKKIRNFKTNIS